MWKSLWQAVLDFIFAPLRFTGISESSELLQKLKLTTLEEERINAVLPYVQGRLLDIGCGRNMLVNKYKEKGGDGIGIDVYDYGSKAIIVEDSSNLPFPDNSFDTIVFIACLNHIPYRLDALKEAHRLVSDGGQLIITMINPVIGFLVHKIWELINRGLDVERGMKEGEVYGLWRAKVLELSASAGFHLTMHKRFDYGLNNIYIFKRMVLD